MKTTIDNPKSETRISRVVTKGHELLSCRSVTSVAEARSANTETSVRRTRSSLECGDLPPLPALRRLIGSVPSAMMCDWLREQGQSFVANNRHKAYDQIERVPTWSNLCRTSSRILSATSSTPPRIIFEKKVGRDFSDPLIHNVQDKIE